MFERFTDRARQTVVLAQEEARQLNHNYIGTEHLLLGLLRESEGVGAKALRRLGIRLDAVRADVVELIGSGSQPAPSGHIPFTPRSKKVLELSLREALTLGHNYIGTEHILLGLVREGEGVATQVLVKRGAELERIRATVLDMLRGLGNRPGPVPARRTPAADEAVSAAQELAGSAPVGSHHLLEALARSEDSLASKALASLGVDPDTLAAKIDELGVDGTNDVTPEEEAARKMVVLLAGDEVQVVLRDETTVELVRAIVEPLGGPLRGDDPAAGSLVGLWQAIGSGLDDVRRRVVPPPEEAETGPSRPSIVRAAIQSRLRRRTQGR
jgi:ATP-dependent Clp protease ATP-binding subunit ClpC